MSHHRGLTLVELLIGLAITGMVGAAIAAMSAAVANGVEGGGELRRVAAQHAMVTDRLAGTIRYSRAPVACFDYTGNDGVAQRYLVLWMGDTTTTSNPNLSEIRVLQWDLRPTRQRMTSYRVTLASGTTDTAYPLTGGFTFLAKWIEGEVTNPPKPAGVTLVPEIWANSISDAHLKFGHTSKTTYTDAEVQAANLVSYRLTIKSGDGEAIACGAAAPRNTQ